MVCNFSNYNYNVCSQTVADDILVALSKTGLEAEHMLEFCINYSCKWRYDYNVDTCTVLVFNEMEDSCVDRRWKLGNNVIRQVKQCTQLGIVCDKYLTLVLSYEEHC